MADSCSALLLSSPACTGLHHLLCVAADRLLAQISHAAQPTAPLPLRSPHAAAKKMQPRLEPPEARISPKPMTSWDAEATEAQASEEEQVPKQRPPRHMVSMRGCLAA